MPYIDIDIDVDDFISSCSSREKENLVKDLAEEGYKYEDGQTINSPNVDDIEWTEILDKLKKIRFMMDSEDEAIIKRISEKY